MHVVLLARWVDYMKMDSIFKCSFYFNTLKYYKYKQALVYSF